MKALESQRLSAIWNKFSTVVVFCFFVYFALYNSAPNYFGLLYTVGYKLLALVLIGGFILFGRFREGIELKLVFAYCLWLVAVRVIDGSLAVEGTIDSIVNRFMILPYLGFALIISSEQRLKLLDVMAVVYSVFYTLVGAVCIYAVINQITVINPITGTELCEQVSGRIYVFWKNCNTVGTWFYMACAFLTYLFFRSKKWGRILIVPAFVICYLALALTYSRSSMLGFALSAGMLAVLMGFKYLPLHKVAHRAGALVVLMCLFVPLAYKSFELSTTLINDISQSVAESKPEESLAETDVIAPGEQQLDEAASPNEDFTEDLNSRGFNGSGRVELWAAAILSLGEDPARIVTGSPTSIIPTNQYIQKYMPEQYAYAGVRIHHHNSYLEILMDSGLPGFVLMAAFLLILVIKMIRLFFTECAAATLAVKSLTIMQTGMIIYNFFESALFYIYDMRTVIFCLIAGYILAFEKELCKAKQSR